MTDESKDPNLNKKQPEPAAEPKKKKEKADPVLNEEVDKSKEALSDKLDTPGGLEIEEMAESTELQKRRDQTKKRLQALADVEEEPSAVNGASPFESDDGGFSSILREANLSPRHIRFCCSGVLLVVFLVFGTLGIMKLIDSNKDSPKKIKDNVEVEEEVSVTLNDDIDSSLYTGLLLGAHLVKEDLGTDLGEDLGDLPLPEDSFARMIDDFSDIFNSLQVDVQNLLDQSRDRESTLDEYVDQLEFHLFLTKENISQLQDEINELSDDISLAEADRDENEEEFFADLNVLDAYGSQAALDDFVEQSQEVVELRAEFRARQTLLSYYSNIRGDLELRIRDIELNREALIKGVQIVDLQGSDLDLVIDENAL